MRLRIIKHVPFEGPGAIAAWANERGHAVQLTELGLGEALPQPSEFDALVLMGGPMSVTEEGLYSWLRPEKALVRTCLGLGKKMLGVCLGSQMIASALGADIRRNAHKEIGWFPIVVSPAGRDHPFFRRLPPSMCVFHWHGETYDLPPGAVHLAASAACENQAYALGTQVLALQCHPEVDEASLREMAEGGGDELMSGGPFVQCNEDLFAHPEYLERLRPVVRMLLDNWLVA